LREIGVNVAAILVKLTEFKRPCDCCRQQPALTSHFDGRDPNLEMSSEHKNALLSTISYRNFSMSPLDCLCGFDGTTVVTGNAYDRKYVSSFHLRLLSRLVVSIDFTVRLRTWEWLSSLSLTGSKVTLKQVVREDSEFMLASARGDVVTMRRLLGGKKASPYMVADGNVTPLALVIESGVVEAVDLLLTCGADPNDIFGSLQTSPLAWALKWRSLAVTRLLMERGASYHHLNVWGWSPLFYLWSRTSQHPSSTEYLELLRSQYDFPALYRGLLDEEGWSVMHRATAFGTPEDVSQLVRYGLDPLERIVDRETGDLGWRVMHVAVHYGNIRVFLELVPYYRQLGLELPDLRGWTLLHIAARQGHDEIVRHLLGKGANPRAKTKVAWVETPEGLRGRECSVAEVALAFGEDRYLAFMAALDDVLSSGTDEDESWHDANE
jgi:ankyrin repeat protein